MGDQPIALDAEIGAALLGITRECRRLGDADEFAGDVDALLVRARVERARIAREHVDGGVGVGELGAAIARNARIAMQTIEIVLQTNDVGRRAGWHGRARGAKCRDRAGRE